MFDRPKAPGVEALAARAGMDDRALGDVLAYWNRRLLEQRQKDWT